MAKQQYISESENEGSYEIDVREQLIECIKSNDLNRIKAICEEYEIDFSDNNGELAMLAIRNVKILKFMVETSPSLISKCQLELLVAVANNDAKDSIIYLTKEKQIDYTIVRGENVYNLCLRLILSDKEAVDIIRKMPQEEQKAAFYLAVKGEDKDLTYKMLSNFSKFIDTADQYGQTPLHWSAAKGDSKSVELLLNKIPEVESTKVIECSAIKKQTIDNRYTALHLAVHNGHNNVISLLSTTEQSKQLVYIKDKNGQTPLHWAAGKGNLKAVEILLNNIKNIEGIKEAKNSIVAEQTEDNKYTALHLAIHGKHDEVVKTLVNEYPGLVSIVDKYYQTPLHWAGGRLNDETIMLLIGKMTKDDLTKKSTSGHQARDWLKGKVGEGVMDFLDKKILDDTPKEGKMEVTDTAPKEIQKEVTQQQDKKTDLVVAKVPNTGSITPTTVYPSKLSPINPQELIKKLEQYNEEIRQEAESIDEVIKNQQTLIKEVLTITPMLQEEFKHKLEKMGEKPLVTKNENGFDQKASDFSTAKIYQLNLASEVLSLYKSPFVVHYGIDAEATKPLQGNILPKDKSLHPIEQQVISKALGYLEKTCDSEHFLKTSKNIYPNNVVLIDFFPRKAEDTATGFRIGKDIKDSQGNTEVHTIGLWRTSKGEVALIEPNNPNFSQFLVGTMYNGKTQSFKIIQPDKKAKQIYSNNELENRDCTDIAVKLAFELNEKQKSSTLKKTTEIYDAARKQISNQGDNGITTATHLSMLSPKELTKVQSSDQTIRTQSKKIIEKFLKKRTDKEFTKIFNPSQARSLQDIDKMLNLFEKIKSLSSAQQEVYFSKEEKKDSSKQSSKMADKSEDTDITTTAQLDPDKIVRPKGVGVIFHPPANKYENELMYLKQQCAILCDNLKRDFLTPHYFKPILDKLNSFKDLKWDIDSLTAIEGIFEIYATLPEGVVLIEGGNYNIRGFASPYKHFVEEFKESFNQIYEELKKLCSTGNVNELEKVLKNNPSVKEMLSHNEGELGILSLDNNHPEVLKLLYKYSEGASEPISSFTQTFLKKAIEGNKFEAALVLVNQSNNNAIAEELLKQYLMTLPDMNDKTATTTFLEKLITHLANSNQEKVKLYNGCLEYQLGKYEDALNYFSEFSKGKLPSDKLVATALFYEACCAQYLYLKADHSTKEQHKQASIENFKKLQNSESFKLQADKHIEAFHIATDLTTKSQKLEEAINQTTLVKTFLSDIKIKLGNLIANQNNPIELKKLSGELQQSILNVKYVELPSSQPETIALSFIFENILDDVSLNQKIGLPSDQNDVLNSYKQEQKLLDQTLELVGEISDGHILEPLEFY